MNTIDLNCDMGEGLENEEVLMPFITSANISCGFHAGNSKIIAHVINIAQKYNVNIGAHPSFHDRENFGRKEIRLPVDKIYAIVLEQLIKISLIAEDKGAALHHVKPHGGLYNVACRDANVAKAIVQAVADFNENLVLYGLSGSQLMKEASMIGLKTKCEVFADRRYLSDGSLAPRTDPQALIKDDEACLTQVRQMIQEGVVTAITGELVPVKAETICIHGDGAMALSFAQKIHLLLQQLHCEVQPT